MIPSNRKRSCMMPAVIRDIVAWMSADISRHMTVHSVAARAGYSPWHFQRMFRAATGHTVATYIRQERAWWAARLLITSHASIFEIAVTVGFNSHASFLRVFNGFFGMTPTAWREMHLKGDCALPGVSRHPSLHS